MLFVKILLILILSIVILYFYIKYKLPKKKRKNTIAFFHLYCSSGGGGERVLWHTIEALFRKYPHYTIYIYSHKNIKDETLEILTKVEELFKIDLISQQSMVEKLEFVQLRTANFIESKRYPILTLFFQNFMSIFVALEAAYRVVPEIYLETIGFTFTLPVFKLLFNSTTITYVHYPTISNDMIENVKTNSHPSFNNRAMFVRSPILRNTKLFYYRMLAYLYGWAGRKADLVMVNSTWTKNHIQSLWKREAHVVYPPCDVESFEQIYLKNLTPTKTTEERRKSGSLNIISIGQFRPEKNHQLQIEAFDSFLNRTQLYDSTLTLYGGCRDKYDEKRVSELKEMIVRLELGDRVRIKVGVSFETLIEDLREADVAMHTMQNEHFGIVLLECMAAGLLMIAHDSGGPRMDIINDRKNGFLADNVDDYTDKLIEISEMDLKDRQIISKNARDKATQFSTKVFETNFIKLVEPYLKAQPC